MNNLTMSYDDNNHPHNTAVDCKQNMLSFVHKFMSLIDSVIFFYCK